MLAASPSGGATRCGCLGLLALAAAWLAPQSARAQATEELRAIRPLIATPIGALPPAAMPMPASRDHNYWGVCLQAGHRRGGDEPDQRTFALGLDLQWRGGSVLGVTAGYRTVSCDVAAADCDGHTLFGARARFNVITGGPTLGALLGDYSATTTLGTEVGIGYAPAAPDGGHSCTVDVGVPVSLAMLQSVRLVSFLGLGVAWELGCANASARGATFLASAGFALQQLGDRPLDVHVGAQKIFRPASGIQVGISLTYMRVP